MGLWNTLAGMLGRSATPAPEQPAAPAAPESATKSMNVAGVRSVLQGRGAGGWASDHRAETEKFTGWHYIAIHSIAMAAAQAEVLVFDDAGTADTSKRRQARRKSLRARFGSVSRWKSLYGGDDRETDPLPTDHPLSRLMKRPNPKQSGALFRYEIVQQIRLTGSAFIWNVPNRLGRVCERYVLPTQVCTPVQPSPMYPQGGWRVDPSLQRYPMVDADGFTEQTGWMRAIGGTLPAEQVQIIKLPHPLYKDDGQSPISAGALWADTADQIDQARFHHVGNAGQPSLLVTAPPDTQPSEEELAAAREKLKKQLCGPKNAGGLAMATGGTVITEFGTTPRDMSYDTGFEQSKSANLAIHQTPPVAAGIQEAGAYAAYLASMRQFTTTSVQPLLDLISEEDSHVIAPQFGPGLVIEIEAKSFDDPEQVERELATDITGRSITKNELRAVRGRPALSPEQGGDDWAGQNPAPAVGMYPNSSSGVNWPTPPTGSEEESDPPAPSDSESETFPPLPKRRASASKTLQVAQSEYP
jgi:phage portal protein BeeE